MAEPSATTTAKEHMEIEIKAPRFSTEFFTGADDLLKEPPNSNKVPFFRPLSRGRESTWIVSLFVIIHLVAFVWTMCINNCWHNSNGDCAFQSLGRISFQPLPENPFLGPSASTLDEVGALQQSHLTMHHEMWRLFISPLLHSGFFHLIINLSCIGFVGIHLEHEFGPLRIGVIYILSAFTGSFVAALFLQDRPSVTSSGALFGLLGTMLSGLILNWKFYSRKLAALITFSSALMINLLLGLLPYVNNFSNIGGFVSGFLLGFLLLCSPRLGKMVKCKGDSYDYDYDVKPSFKLSLKLDRPVLRSVSLVIYSIMLVGVTIAVLHGINLFKYCTGCTYIDCVPFKCCSNKVTHCETMVSPGRMTLTCEDSDKFRTFPFFNASQARLEDLCNLICS